MINATAVSALSPLNANPTKWSNTQTIRQLLSTNCLSVFDHFVGLALKGLTIELFLIMLQFNLIVTILQYVSLIIALTCSNLKKYS